MNRRSAEHQGLARRFATLKNGVILALVIVLGWWLQTQAWRIKMGFVWLFRNVSIGLVLKWWAIILVASAAGIGLVLAWDWFFYRRLPFARWKVNQDIDTRETNLLRELTRLRRIQDAFSRPADREDDE